ncbi:YfhO family protein [Anaerorhabdus sp.]|uniref:YfhO family protein n=1 Tax=Anaerorhabdus sp. TaxID=1872524 RepID=UPI002B1FC11E|nr:YfhO family protein [Anaerorhabdus sp.]MEA4875915.1 YfhO family protein [Anaerorhabdus sp.]
MKNSLKLKQNIILFVVFTIIIFVLFNPYSFNLIKSLITGSPLNLDQLYIIQDDWIQQGIPFYKEFFNLLDSGKLAWSWNLFLGNDFFTSKAVLYMTSDIFAYLGYLINKFINFVPNTLFILTLFKCYLSGFTFFYFLKNFKLKYTTKLLFSSLFIATGWSLIFLEHPIFLSFYCLTPLLMAGIENVLQRNKFSLLVIVAALLIAMHYYLAWTMCIYILIYWCIRYFMIHEYNIKAFFQLSFKTLGAFIIGVLIAAIVWVPSLMYMINSPRLVTEGIASYTTWSSTNILAIIMNFFIPVTKFDNLLYHDMWYYFYQIGIYSGILPLLLIPQYFKQDFSKKEKQLFATLLILTLLTLISPFIGKIFQFTYSLRYTIIFNFTLLIIAAIVFNNLKKVNVKLLLFTEFIILLTILFLGVILPSLNNLDLKIYPEIKMLFMAAMFSMIYTILLILFNSKKNVIYLLGLFAIAEMLYQGNQAIISYSKNEIIKATYISNSAAVESTYKLLKELDPSFYRINLQVDETIPEVDTTNFGLYYNIPTLKTYDSLYNYYSYDFLKYTRQYPEVNWIFHFDDFTIYDNLVAKYSIVSTDVDLNFYYYSGEEIFIEGIPDGYKVFKHHGDFAMAKTYNSFIGTNEMLALSEDDNIYLHELANILTNNLVVDDKLLNSLSSKYSQVPKQFFNPTDFTNNSISFNINLAEDAIVYFSIPYSDGWKITSNNTSVTPQLVNGGFVGLELKKGANEIHFNYTIPYFNIGLIISGIGLALGGLLLIKKLYKKH